jgi:hypothetical protein
MTAYTDGQEVAPSSFGRFHLDADDEAHLDGVSCSPESPDRVISVTINGATYEPNWNNDGSTYSAVLVSAGNSPKRKPPPPDTAGGGTPTVPYTSFAMGAGTSTQGGMAVGDAGEGNFGTRFSWYVEAVHQRELAAVNDRSENIVSAAGHRDV